MLQLPSQSGSHDLSDSATQSMSASETLSPSPSASSSATATLSVAPSSTSSLVYSHSPSTSASSSASSSQSPPDRAFSSALAISRLPSQSQSMTQSRTRSVVPIGGSASLTPSLSQFVTSSGSASGIATRSASQRQTQSISPTRSSSSARSGSKTPSRTSTPSILPTGSGSSSRTASHTPLASLPVSPTSSLYVLSSSASGQAKYSAPASVSSSQSSSSSPAKSRSPTTSATASDSISPTPSQFASHINLVSPAPCFVSNASNSSICAGGAGAETGAVGNDVSSGPSLATVGASAGAALVALFLCAAVAMLLLVRRRRKRLDKEARRIARYEPAEQAVRPSDLPAGVAPLPTSAAQSVEEIEAPPSLTALVVVDEEPETLVAPPAPQPSLVMRMNPRVAIPSPYVASPAVPLVDHPPADNFTVRFDDPAPVGPSRKKQVDAVSVRARKNWRVLGESATQRWLNPAPESYPVTSHDPSWRERAAADYRPPLSNPQPSMHWDYRPPWPPADTPFEGPTAAQFDGPPQAPFFNGAPFRVAQHDGIPYSLPAEYDSVPPPARYEDMPLEQPIVPQPDSAPLSPPRIMRRDRAPSPKWRPTGVARAGERRIPGLDRKLSRLRRALTGSGPAGESQDASPAWPAREAGGWRDSSWEGRGDADLATEYGDAAPERRWEGYHATHWRPEGSPESGQMECADNWQRRVPIARATAAATGDFDSAGARARSHADSSPADRWIEGPSAVAGPRAAAHSEQVMQRSHSLRAVGSIIGNEGSSRPEGTSPPPLRHSQSARNLDPPRHPPARLVSPLDGGDRSPYPSPASEIALARRELREAERAAQSPLPRSTSVPLLTRAGRSAMEGGVTASGPRPSRRLQPLRIPASGVGAPGAVGRQPPGPLLTTTPSRGRASAPHFFGSDDESGASLPHTPLASSPAGAASSRALSAVDLSSHRRLAGLTPGRVPLAAPLSQSPSGDARISGDRAARVSAGSESAAPVSPPARAPVQPRPLPVVPGGADRGRLNTLQEEDDDADAEAVGAMGGSGVRRRGRTESLLRGRLRSGALSIGSDDNEGAGDVAAASAFAPARLERPLRSTSASGPPAGVGRVARSERAPSLPPVAETPPALRALILQHVSSSLRALDAGAPAGRPAGDALQVLPDSAAGARGATLGAGDGDYELDALVSMLND